MNFLPCNPEGLAEFDAWNASSTAAISAMRIEREGRHAANGTSLKAALAANASEGSLELLDFLAQDMERVEDDPSPAGFYRLQAYSRARAVKQIQIYQFELERMVIQATGP
ncbi:hypothetical protein [Stenotrophomonas maltophilia]|uniref:hypothetical protein n=1 Tax=Stenotrophomonas maltophilia TaxID=40324 RepID=UPI000A69A262|nr:hypothetical protein [Stenotrophomonas maltophilia]